jgi:hypothetical protein
MSVDGFTAGPDLPSAVTAALAAAGDRHVNVLGADVAGAPSLGTSVWYRVRR